MGMQPNSTTLVSSVLLSGLKDAALELGVSVTPALKKFGIDPGLLDNTQGLLPLSGLVEFLEYSAKAFKCPHFALLIAKHRPALGFGVLTHLLNASPDVETALVMGHRHAQLLNPARTWSLETDLRYALIKRVDQSGNASGMSQMLTLTIAQYFRMLEALMVPLWRATSISFIFPKPPSPKPYRDFFGTRVLFGQDFDSIHFPVSDLKTRIPTHDPELLQVIEKHITELEQNPEGRDLTSKAERIISPAMGSDLCTIQFVANRLNMHSKALQRGLKAEGTTFRKVLHETRMQSAKYYLSNSTIELEQLASILGLSCASSLSRAFKLEHGISPKYWRQQRAGLDPQR